MSPAARRSCGAMQVYEQLAETYPSFRRNQERINELTVRSIASGEAQKVTRRLITIPVVVHVVYKRAAENISKGQIRSQIKVLNRDFRATNPDRSNVPDSWKSLVGDAKIEFALAKKDPRDRPTDGITRTETESDAFSAAGDPVKKKSAGGVTAWPTNRYLNIWVCNLADGLLGYAQFPGGPARTDGAVILYSAFGPWARRDHRSTRGGRRRTRSATGSTCAISGPTRWAAAEPITWPTRRMPPDRTTTSPAFRASRARTGRAATCS